MTDKELLELAAKAAGIKGEYKSNGLEGWSGICLMDCMGNYPNQVWNPLTDDGDALRLVVNLNIEFDNVGQSCTAYQHNYDIGCDEPHGDNPHAAIRRAIVRAAAEIGVQKRG